MLQLPAYNDVQTGPKAQLGGLHVGLSRCSYQPLILFLVTMEPGIAPANGRSVATTPWSDMAGIVVE